MRWSDPIGLTYKRAGQDKLRVSADLHEVAERVAKAKQIFSELAA